MPKGKTIVQVASDSVTSLALTSDGAVYSWGGNTHGQLGNGTNTDSNAPFAMQTTGTPMDGKRIVQVISEQVHSLAIADDGTVYAWGDNSSGALGNGTNTGSNIPVAVKTIGTPMEGKAAVYAAAGLGYSLALASDGTVYAWGNNEHGQLGNGTTINSTVSAAVSLTGNSALAPSTPKVTIGSVPATDVTIVDSNTITVKVPAHANGLVDVTVDLGNGDPLYKAVKTNAFRYGPNLATPGSGGAGSANGGNGQHYRGSRTGGTLANIGDNLTILFFAAGVLIAGALTLIIGVRLRRDWQVQNPKEHIEQLHKHSAIPQTKAANKDEFAAFGGCVINVIGSTQILVAMKNRYHFLKKAIIIAADVPPQTNHSSTDPCAL